MSKTRANLGFDETLENLDPNEWVSPKGQGSLQTHTIKKEEIRQVAEATGFTSREAAPSTLPRKEPRKRRVYRTGRNEQFNLKVRPIDKQRFLEITDQQEWVLGETLQRALEALQRELDGQGVSSPIP